MNIDKMRELEHILYILSNFCEKVESPILFKSPLASLAWVCRAQNTRALQEEMHSPMGSLLLKKWQSKE